MFFYLTRSLNKCIPLDSGKEAAKKVGIEIGVAQSEFYIAEFERKVVRRTSFGVACEEVVCDKTDHGEIEDGVSRVAGKVTLWRHAPYACDVHG